MGRSHRGSADDRGESGQHGDVHRQPAKPLSVFDLFQGPGELFSTVLPTAALSLAPLLATLASPAEPVRMHLTQDTWNPSRVELGTYIALFCVNLLVVFRVLHWLPALAATVAGVLLLRRAKLLAQVDYTLLLTFVDFFVVRWQHGADRGREHVDFLHADRT